MSEKLKSVIFICTANRYRSPLAAALFQKQLKDEGKAEEWRVGSAGTWTQADLPVIPHAFQKAQEMGLDLGEHRSVEISKEILSQYDLIAVMESGHKEGLGVEFPELRKRIFLLSEIVDHIVYDIPDPAKAMDDADQIIDELFDLLQHGHAAICAIADEMNSV